MMIPTEPTVSPKSIGSAAPTRHLPALDGLRGVAVILVFFFHISGGANSSNPLIRALGDANKVGWSGVTLFFLLSGFLITGILWDSKGQDHWLRNFYVRRSLRIWPLYYGCLIVLVIVSVLNGTFQIAVENIWVLILYLQDIPHFVGFVYKLPPPLMAGHFWTIAVEEQFYLLWPFVIGMTRTRRQAAWVCLSTFALSLVFRIYACQVLQLTGDLYLLLPARAGELALGGYLAIAYRSSYWKRLIPFLGPLSLIGFAVFLLLSKQAGYALSDFASDTGGLAAITVSFAAVLALAVDGGIVAKVASWPLLRWIGKISFGIYVYHWLLLNVFGRCASFFVGVDTGTSFLAVRLVIAALGTVTISWLSFTFYESPILKYRKYFLSR